MVTVHQWGRWEGAFEAAVDHVDPLAVAVTVELTAPSGDRRRVDAFWDGGRTWRVRLCPGGAGDWRYVTNCSDPGERGLHGQTGGFECVPYGGDNPLYKHGAVQVAPTGRYLEHADGTPFFFLADTCWNGPLRSSTAEWEEYLSDRAGKRFNAVIFTSTQFRAIPHDPEGRVAFTGKERIAINPDFFRRVDDRVDAMNDHGFLAVPLLLHAGDDTELNAGFALPEDQAIVLARYLVARYGGHHVLWDLVAEGQFHEPEAAKWRRVGRAVFGDGPHAPVTLHPWGMDLPLEPFRDERWLTVAGYQSAHGDSEASLRWIPEGEPSTKWQQPPARPFINLEPPYEGHLGTHSRRPFDDVAVRRAIYWSLLASPTAGVAYGGHGVWGWDDGTGAPFGHARTGRAPHWRDALGMPGATSMRVLAEIFAMLPWWTLRPAPELLADQPGRDDPRHIVVSSRTEDGALTLVYVPQGGRIVLRTDGLSRPASATWVDPRTGERHAAGSPPDDVTWQPTPPSGEDWVLLIERGSA